MIYKFLFLSVWLMGTVMKADAAAVIRYDFMTQHPTTDVTIADSGPVVRDGFKFWGGEWAGLFAGKIAFDVNSQPMLKGTGGLFAPAGQQKVYILNVGYADLIKVKYSGTNAKVTYSGVYPGELMTTVGAVLTSESVYTVSHPGNIQLTLDQNTLIEYIEVTVPAGSESITIPDAVRTYCSTNPLNFSGKRAIKAYVATDFRNGQFVFSNVTYVPANTGILLVRNGNTTSFQVNIGKSNNPKENVIPVNLFTGVIEPAFVSYDNGATHYVVGKTDTDVGLFKVSTGYKCKANSAYLTVPK